MRSNTWATMKLLPAFIFFGIAFVAVYVNPISAQSTDLTVPGETHSTGSAAITSAEDQSTQNAASATAAAALAPAAAEATTQGNDTDQTTTQSMISSESGLTSIVTESPSNISTTLEDSKTSAGTISASATVSETTTGQTTARKGDSESSTGAPVTSETTSEQKSSEKVDLETIKKELDTTTKSEAISSAAAATTSQKAVTEASTSKITGSTTDPCDETCWPSIKFVNATYKFKDLEEFCKTFLEAWGTNRTLPKEASHYICSKYRGQSRRSAYDETQFDFKKDGNDIIVSVLEPTTVPRDETMNYLRHIRPAMATASGMSEKLMEVKLNPAPEKTKGAPPTEIEATLEPNYVHVHFIIAIIAVFVACALYFNPRRRREKGSPTDKRRIIEEGRTGPTGASNPMSDADIVKDEAPAPMQEVANPAVTTNGGGQHISKADEDNGWVVPLDELSKEEMKRPEVENTKL